MSGTSFSENIYLPEPHFWIFPILPKIFSWFFQIFPIIFFAICSLIFPQISPVIFSDLFLIMILFITFLILSICLDPSSSLSLFLPNNFLKFPAPFPIFPDSSDTP
jgi:hypothetical protein